MLVLLLVAFGGYINYAKCVFEPTRKIEFLGFNINSQDCTVAVPEEKYKKAMAAIDEFLEAPFLDVKSLEKLRGRLCSWFLVIPILRLFIREQNQIIRKADIEKKTAMTWAEISKENLKTEFKIWKNLELIKLSRPWREDRHEVFSFSTGEHLGKSKISIKFYSQVPF